MAAREVVVAAAVADKDKHEMEAEIKALADQARPVSPPAQAREVGGAASVGSLPGPGAVGVSAGEEGVSRR